MAELIKHLKSDILPLVAVFLVTFAMCGFAAPALAHETDDDGIMPTSLTEDVLSYVHIYTCNSGVSSHNIYSEYYKQISFQNSYSISKIVPFESADFKCIHGGKVITYTYYYNVW